ncbi:MAG: hypothetical protein V1779_11305 [bacterium]
MKKIFLIILLFCLISSFKMISDKRIDTIKKIMMAPDSLENYLHFDCVVDRRAKSIMDYKIGILKNNISVDYEIYSDENFFLELPEIYHGSVITVVNKNKTSAQAFIFNYKDSLIWIRDQLTHNPEELAITYIILDNIIKEPDSLLFYQKYFYEGHKESTLEIIQILKVEFQDGYEIIENGWYRNSDLDVQAWNMIEIRSKKSGRELLVDFRKENDKWYIFDFSERDY